MFDNVAPHDLRSELMSKHLNIKFLFLSLSLLSSAGAAIKKSNNSIDMEIESLDYTRPKSGIGISGELLFKSLVFFRDGLYLQLNNKDTIFDSDIFIRPGFVGFTGPYTSLGYNIEDDSPLKDLQKLTIAKSKILINDRFFRLSGKNFTYKDKEAQLTLENYGYHCKGHPDYNSTDADGIIAGCLTNSKVTPLTSKKNSNTTLNLSYIGTDKDGETKLDGKVKKIEIKKKKLLMDIAQFSLDVGDFDINGKKLQMECKKNEELLTFDSDALLNECLGEMSIVSPIVKIVDKEEDSNFLFDVKKFVVENKRVSFESNNFKLFDSESQTDMEDLTIDCDMESSVDDLFDASRFVNQCIIDGEITIHKVYNEEYKNNIASLVEYKSLLKPEAAKSISNEKEATAIKNINIKISDHYFKFKAKVKIWPTHYKISASGVVNRGPKDEIIIDIRKTKLPFFITSKSIFLYYFKKYMVSETIQVKNDKIYITL